MRGHFEDLEQYVAVGFKPTEEVVSLCSKDYREGGIFLHTKEDEDKIRRTNLNGRPDSEKFLEFTAYLFELGYDLALSKEFNVSKSPGFEGFGLFMKEEEEETLMATD